jgi:hypothetical protein
MSDPLLPPGIKVGACTTLDEKPAVRVDLELTGGDITFVGTPAEARTFGLWLIQQPDRKVRAFGALLVRQARLVEDAGGYRGLHVVGGSGA